MNIEELANLIESSSEEKVVFLDKTDDRLSEISGLAQNSKFTELSPLSIKLFEESSFDIRIVNFFLYSNFLEQEIKGLLSLSKILNLLIGDQSNKIGPKLKKPTHLLKSSTWLFNEIHNFIHFHKQQASDKWNDWLEIEDLEKEISLTNEEIKSFESFFPEDVKKNKTILESGAKLRNILQALSVQAGQIREDIERIKQEAAHTEEVSISVKNMDSSNSKPTETPKSKALSPVVGEVSAPLAELHEKLEAFKMLIEKKDLAKASLIANDISQIIENFDPRVYFPSLFTDYYKLLNRNIDQISGHWNNRGSVIWNTMEDLYKIDLKSFLNMDE